MSNAEDIGETRARYLLVADSRDQVVVQRDKQSFCQMVFREARMMGIQTTV